MAKWLESRTRNPKVVTSSLRSGRNCRWGEWMYSALFHLQYHDWGVLEQGTEPSTAPRAPQHKWLPTALGVCSLLCVCALNAEHKFPVWVTSSLSQNGFFFCAAVSADYISAVTVTNCNNSKQIWQKQKAEHTDYQQKHKVNCCCSISSPQFQEQIFINRQTNKEMNGNYNHSVPLLSNARRMRRI